MNMELTIKDVLSERRLNCPICNYRASSTCKYQSHIGTHVDPFDRTIFKCFFCDHRAKTLLNLREHMFVHGDHSEKLKCFACNVFCKSEVDFKDHIWLHQSLDKQMFKCIYCNQETYSVNTMKMHMLIHKNYIAVQECCLCHYKSKSRGDLLRHFIIHKESPYSAMFICNFCEYKTEHLSDLRLHLSIHGDEIGVFKCCACDYECSSKVGLTKHFLIHRVYSNLDSFRCSFCNYMASYLGSFRLHMLKHSESSNSAEFSVCLYNCHLCDYKTNNEHDFKLHSVDSHTNSSSDIICVEEQSETTKYQNKTSAKETHKNRCGTQFSTINNSRKEHYLQNVDSNDQSIDNVGNDETSVEKQNKKVPHERKYRCDECSFSAMRLYNLNSHKEIHQGRSERKLFRCKICGRSYTTKSSLKKHRLLHMDPKERPMLYCEKCEYNTVYRSSLVKHIKLKHSNKENHKTKAKKKNKSSETQELRRGKSSFRTMEERKHHCDECSYSAVHLYNLNRHKKTHQDRSERKLFHCKTCGHSYTTKGSFNQHKLLHMDPEDRPLLYCEKCEYNTVYRSSLNKHMKSKHSNEENPKTRAIKETESSETQEYQSDKSCFRAVEEHKYRCDECSYFTTDQCRFKRHKESHKDRSDRKLFCCNSCGNSYTTKNSLKQHNLLHMNPKERPMLYCEKCEFKTIYRNSLTKHIKLEHSNEEKETAINEKASSETQDYQCDECSFCTAKKKLLNRHKETHKDRSARELFYCNICDSSYVSRQSLKRHALIHLEPNESPMLSCEKCKYKTLDRSALKEHIESIHANVHLDTNKQLEFQCYHCDFRTGDKFEMKSHRLKHSAVSSEEEINEKLTHTNETNQHIEWESVIVKSETKPDIEELVSESSTVIKKESSEMEQYQCDESSFCPVEERKYHCDECSFSTINRNTFYRHKESHKDRSERKLFYCNICGRSYTTEGSLKQHSLLHVEPNERPMLYCEKCEYKTIYRSGLNNHIRAKHSKVKNQNRKSVLYQCGECQYRSSSVANLQRHQKTHKDRSEQLLFECAICGAKFTVKFSLKHHILNRHLDPNKQSICRQILHCEKCKYRTSSRFRLNRHIKSKHSVLHECKVCQFQSNSLINLKRHEEAHNNCSDGSYECASTDSTKHSTLSLNEQTTKKLQHVEPESVAIENATESNMEDSLNDTQEERKYKCDEPMLRCERCEYQTLYKSCLMDHIKAKHLQILTVPLVQLKFESVATHNDESEKSQHTEPEHLPNHPNEQLQKYECDMYSSSFISESDFTADYNSQMESHRSTPTIKPSDFSFKEDIVEKLEQMQEDQSIEPEFEAVKDEMGFDMGESGINNEASEAQEYVCDDQLQLIHHEEIQENRS